MAFQLTPPLLFSWTDNNGQPADGWLVNTYEASTGLRAPTYTSTVGDVANSNPVELVDGGKAYIYLDSNIVYRFVITNSGGGESRTFDNITGLGGVFTGGSTPAGAFGSIQYNNNGFFGGFGSYVNGIMTIENGGVGSHIVNVNNPSIIVTDEYNGTSAVQKVESNVITRTDTLGTGQTKNEIISTASSYYELLSGTKSIKLYVDATESYVLADKIKATDGLPTEFLKADGSRDSNTYVITSDLSSYVPYTGATGDVNLGANNLLLTGDIGTSTFADYMNKIYSKQVQLSNAGGVFNNRLLQVIQDDSTSTVDASYIVNTGTGNTLNVSNNGAGGIAIYANSDNERAIYSATTNGTYSGYFDGGTIASVFAENGIVAPSYDSPSDQTQKRNGVTKLTHADTLTTIHQALDVQGSGTFDSIVTDVGGVASATNYKLTNLTYNELVKYMYEARPTIVGSGSEDTTIFTSIGTGTNQVNFKLIRNNGGYFDRNLYVEQNQTIGGSQYITGTSRVNGATNFGRVATLPTGLLSGDKAYLTTKSTWYEFNGTDWIVDFAYAGIYVDDGATAQAIATGATYTKLTGFALDQISRNATSDVANDQIVITELGDYDIGYSISYQSGTPNITFEVGVFGGLTGAPIEQPQIHTDRKLSSADTGSASGCGLLRVTAVPYYIDLRASHDSGSSVNLTMVSSSLIAKKIGV